jgi:hypothetical protein
MNLCGQFAGTNIPYLFMVFPHTSFSNFWAQSRMDWGYNSMIQHLRSMHESLDSTPSTLKKKKKKVIHLFYHACVDKKH